MVDEVKKAVSCFVVHKQRQGKKMKNKATVGEKDECSKCEKSEM